MSRFSVKVIAGFAANARLLQAMVDVPRDPHVPVGIPYWKTSAADWSVTEHADPSFPAPDGFASVQAALTVHYLDVEGHDEQAAERFAQAIFVAEWKRTGLPVPEIILTETETPP